MRCVCSGNPRCGPMSLLVRSASQSDQPPSPISLLVRSCSEIGVGMAVDGHPSLRTGLADFPHPALQSVSHPLAAGLVRLARAKAYREISPSFSKNALG